MWRIGFLAAVMTILATASSAEGRCEECLAYEGPFASCLNMHVGYRSCTAEVGVRCWKLRRCDRPPANDRFRTRLAAFDFSGNRRGRTPLPDSLPIEAAQYGADGWNILARLTTGYWAVARHREGRWRLQAIPIRAAERGGAVPLIAELDGGRIVVLERRAPHQALVIERNGAARWMTGDAGLSGPSVPRTDPGPIIHVTGLFRLQSYLLRVTADLRSDWRQLALLDRDGRILRTRELEVPFGILTVSDDGSAALGLRGEPSRELVLYEISVPSPSPLVVTSTTRRMSDDLHGVAGR